MTRKRVDYDCIAPRYNERYAGGQRSATAEALAELAQQLKSGRVLEVGCGTGNWLAGLANLVPQVVGFDLSAGMLAQARGRSASLQLVRGRAERLPFPQASFDLVLCVNAIHHFDEPDVFITEAWRLLRPGGALAVLGMDPRERRTDWYVYRYFEGTYETDLQRFPSWGQVLDWMVACGAAAVEWMIAERISHIRQGCAILDDPFLQKHSSSQLALLSDEEYAVGLERIREAIAQAEAADETVDFSADFSLGMLTGYKQRRS